MVRLLVVLVMATAFVFMGGIALAQSNQELAERAVINAQRLVLDSRALEQIKPLPALPVPPVMTEQGMVQAPNPRPLDSFPVARPRPVAKSQQVAKPIPAIKAPPVVSEKGKVVETPSPRPTQDFPVAKPQQKTPVAEIKRQRKSEEKPAGVISNVEINHIYVQLATPPRNVGEKIAIEKKPGEYILGVGTPRGWEFNPNSVKKVPPDYKIIRGQEVKS